MFCRQCGNALNAGAAVCLKCGLPVGRGKNFCQNCGGQTLEEAVI